MNAPAEGIERIKDSPLFAYFAAIQKQIDYLAIQKDMQGKGPEEIRKAAINTVQELLDSGCTLLSDGTLFRDTREWY